jgi:hypothetical protein
MSGAGVCNIREFGAFPVARNDAGPVSLLPQAARQCVACVAPPSSPPSPQRRGCAHPASREVRFRVNFLAAFYLFESRQRTGDASCGHRRGISPCSTPKRQRSCAPSSMRSAKPCPAMKPAPGHMWPRSSCSSRSGGEPGTRRPPCGDRPAGSAKDLLGARARTIAAEGPAHHGVAVFTCAAPPPRLYQTDPEDEEQDHGPSELTADRPNVYACCPTRSPRSGSCSSRDISSADRACGSVLVAALAEISIALADSRQEPGRVWQFLQKSAFEARRPLRAESQWCRSSYTLNVAFWPDGEIRFALNRIC